MITQMSVLVGRPSVVYEFQKIIKYNKKFRLEGFISFDHCIDKGSVGACP